MEQSISLDRQLNIIQVADLVLPDKDTKFEEYTTMELLSVAMLIVISTFALILSIPTGAFLDGGLGRGVDVPTGGTGESIV